MKISEYTGNIILDKSKWAHPFWEILEVLAFTANTQDKINYFKIFVYIISRQMPCDTCYLHFNEMLKDQYYNIDNYLNKYGDNNITLLKWVWEIHNNVNRRLNKPEYKFDELLEKYNNSKCDKVCSINNIDNTTKDKTIILTKNNLIDNNNNFDNTNDNIIDNKIDNKIDIANYNINDNIINNNNDYNNNNHNHNYNYDYYINNNHNKNPYNYVEYNNNESYIKSNIKSYKNKNKYIYNINNGNKIIL
jgi:hypothetical protein